MGDKDQQNNNAPLIDLVEDISDLVEDIGDIAVDVAEGLFVESDLPKDSKRIKHEHLVMNIRNIIVFIALILFLVSLFTEFKVHLLRGVGYILGAVAYFLEIVLLSDFFRTQVHHKEMFMAYCFGPLYVLMGIAYLKEYFEEIQHLFM